MKTDDRKPTGVRITTAEKDGKIVFFLNRTAKSGSKQNSSHTIIQPMKTKVVNGLDPTALGEAVLRELDLL